MVLINKNKAPDEEPPKRIQIRKDNPVAKALMEKRFHKQVMPSAKGYKRQKVRRQTRKELKDS